MASVAFWMNDVLFESNPVEGSGKIRRTRVTTVKQLVRSGASTTSTLIEVDM